MVGYSSPGLRDEGQCHAVYEPAFGMLEVDWDRRIAKLQIRDHTDGSQVAVGFDGKLMELAINIDTCLQV